MPAYVVTTTATMTCSHSGTVTIQASQQRATIEGAPVATATDQMIVAGCGASSSSPCTKVQWTGLSSRVQAGGQPVMMQSLPPGPVPGDGACVGPPPTTPLVAALQGRVTGT